MYILRICALFTFILATSAVSAEDTLELKQSVMLGGDTEFDACSSYGHVSGLKDVAGNFLALRSHPSIQGTLLEKLENGQEFYICEEVDGWVGIVLPDVSLECGTSSPVADKVPYEGPCKSGWVYGGFVNPVAG